MPSASSLQPGYTPPWHPPVTGGDPRDIEALRAQRAEVEALLAFRHAVEADAARCWWRLIAVRRERLLVTAAALTPLPAPPRGALTLVQRMMLRVGRFRPERARAPAALR